MRCIIYTEYNTKSTTTEKTSTGDIELFECENDYQHFNGISSTKLMISGIIQLRDDVIEHWKSKQNKILGVMGTHITWPHKLSPG
jgi:hypothetical protein